MPPESGYLHPAYAASLAGFGVPVALPASGGWLLRRRIDASGIEDATGPYPLFCCRDWNGLPADLDRLRDALVSVVLVTDPLADCGIDMLRATFEHVVAFRRHYVIDLDTPFEHSISRSHRAHARRALREVEVEICAEPWRYLDDWMRLFGILVERHGIRGPRRFSRQAFDEQFAVPGMTMVRASRHGQTVGLDLWYVQGDCAQGHLAAFDEAGYALQASYATKWTVIEHFRRRQLRWINLGGGRSESGTDGLSRFKQGWTSATRQAWLCGRVLQPQAYAALVAARAPVDQDFFPAYRHGLDD